MKNLLIPALLAFGLLAGACSAADAETSGVASIDASETALEPAAATEVDQEQALMEFAQCMRDQGIDMADPTVDADGNLSLRDTMRSIDVPDRSVIRDARDACAEHLDDVTLGFREADRSEFEDLFVEYASCMRDNGYEDMPDSVGFGPGQAGESDQPPIDFEDPDFQAANEVCQEIFAESEIGGGLPPGGPGRGPGGGNG